MCSIGEDDFGDDGGVHSMIPVGDELPMTTQRTQGECHKCGEKGDIYKLMFREAECQNCFLMYVRHKFRATLGSSKILPKNANVLLIFDATPEAAVLLDMLAYAQSQTSFKRLHCNTKVIYIDDLFMQHPNPSTEIQNKHIARFNEFLEKFGGFESFVMPIFDEKHTVYDLTNVQKYILRDSVSTELNFANNVHNIKTHTSSQDYIRHRRRNLIASAAKQLDCKFVFEPDISTTLATQLLASLALGRGASVALDVSLVDDRLGDIKLLRPLKDLNNEDIVLYLRAQSIEPIQVEQYASDGIVKGSLQSLTKEFVTNLQQNFPSTVSTIFRTGSKMATNPMLNARIEKILLNDDDDDDETCETSSVCEFCHSTLDKDSSTIRAIEFSRLTSANAAAYAGKSFNMENNMETIDMVNARKNDCSRLCHSCRNIKLDCDDVNKLFNK